MRDHFEDTVKEALIEKKPDSWRYFNCYFYGTPDLLTNERLNYIRNFLRENFENTDEPIQYCVEGLVHHFRGEFPEAIEAYQKNIGKEPYSMVRLGNMYCKGEGVTKDLSKALEYYEMAANLISPLGTEVLMFMHYSDYRDEDQRLRVKCLKRMADSGNFAAMMQLGSMYSRGDGVKKNLHESFGYYKMADDLGLNNSSGLIVQLGSMYELGKGVEKNLGNALEYYKKAAGLGNYLAMASVGDMYFEGNGVERNWSQAEAFYGKAAALGYFSILSRLWDIGVNKNNCEKAASAYRKAIIEDKNLLHDFKLSAKALIKNILATNETKECCRYHIAAVDGIEALCQFFEEKNNFTYVTRRLLEQDSTLSEEDKNKVLDICEKTSGLASLMHDSIFMDISNRKLGTLELQPIRPKNY